MSDQEPIPERESLNLNDPSAVELGLEEFSIESGGLRVSAKSLVYSSRELKDHVLEVYNKLKPKENSGSAPYV